MIRSAHQGIDAWNRFFHGEIPDWKVRFLQQGFGLLMGLYFLALAPDWSRWFSEQGVLDAASARANLDPDAHSLMLWFPRNPFVLWAPLVFGFLASLGLLLHRWPRSCAGVLFAVLVTLHHRNNLIWDGEDVLFRLTAFFLIFAGTRTPSGASTAWPLRLVQLELSLVYLSSGLRKLEGDAWRDGSAAYYALHLDDFAGPISLPDLFRESLAFSQMASWFTIAIELVLAFALWFPNTVRSAVRIGVLFHLGMILIFNLFLFHWLMILLLLTHASQDPRLLVSRLAEKLGRHHSQAGRQPT